MKKEMEILNDILQGSKRFTFEYGDYGMTKLELTSYYTGTMVAIDLGKLMEEYPEVMEDIIVEMEED